MKPAFYTITAGPGLGGPVFLPEYSAHTKAAVMRKVLATAEREGYRGSAADRLSYLEWKVVPVFGGAA